MVEITFALYYIIILSVSILLNLILPFLKIYWYFAFSIKQIKENHQYWRFFTNYLIKPTRTVNLGTFMTIISIYIDLHNLEQKVKPKNKYSKFIMIILIQCTLNTLLTYFFYYKFNLQESRSLLVELSYSFCAISSYKNPNGKTFISYIPIKNRFAPIALLILRIYNYKDISLEIMKAPLIGFFSGFLFCILTKKFKIKYIPPFLKKLLNEPTEEERRQRKEFNLKLKNDLLKFRKKVKKIKKDKSKKIKKDKSKNQSSFNMNLIGNPLLNYIENENNKFNNNYYNQNYNENVGKNYLDNLALNDYVKENKINDDNNYENETEGPNQENNNMMSKENNNNNEDIWENEENEKEIEEKELRDDTEKNGIDEEKNEIENDESNESILDEEKKEEDDIKENEKRKDIKNDNKNEENVENKNESHEKND